MRIKVSKDDLSKGKKFPLGWFRLKVTRFESKPSKNKDNPSTNYIFTLVCQPNGNPENDAMIGTSHAQFFNEQAIGNIGPFLEALGAKKDAEGGYDIDPNATLGLELDGYNEPAKNDDGKAYNNFVAWKVAGSSL